MTDHPTGSPTPETDAAKLGLAVIAEAAALHADDPELLHASSENLRDTVDELIDEPLTRRQEEVVETLAAAGGTLTAGLSGALAQQQERTVDEVLGGAAGALLSRLPVDEDGEACKHGEAGKDSQAGKGSEDGDGA